MMVAVPGPTPDVTPVDILTVAIVVLLLLHAPPPARLLSMVALPWQNAVVPVMGNSALMLTVVVAIHPAGVVYVIVDVPAASALTLPTASMVATVVLLLVHVPPSVELLRAVVLPTHAVVVPVIGETGFTVTVVTATHNAVDV